MPEEIAEIKKLQTLYKLKQEIRYHFSRAEEIQTESVAEHVYGMFVVANYFLPLENQRGDWNRTKIYDFILYHDIDEIETGDTIGYLKTNKHRAIEGDAAKRVVAALPEQMQTHIHAVLDEYEAQETIEAQFVKAVDKFEPNVHLLCESGKKTTHFHHTTFEQHMSIKQPAMAAFPIMSRYNAVIADLMRKEGYFT